LETLPPGGQSATITITATDRAGQSKQYAIPVSLDFRLPYVRTVIPNVIAAGSATSLRITGDGLDPATYPDLHVGAQQPQNIHQRFLILTEALFDLPAQAAGPHVVSFTNALGLTRSNATLYVSAAASPLPGAIVSAGTKSKLIYDRVRQQMYAVNPGAARIERFAWNASTSQWDTLASVALTGVLDAALERANHDLIAISDSQLFRISLDAASPTPVPLYTLADRNCGRSLFHIGVADNDHALVTYIQNTCAGGADPPLIFDLILGTSIVTTPTNTAVAAGLIAGSGREFLTYIGASQGTPTNSLLRFDSPTDYVSAPYLPEAPPQIMAIDTDNTGTYVLLNNSLLGALGGSYATASGNLPTPIGRAVRLGPGSALGSRIYSYVYQVNGTRRVDVRDLNWQGFMFTDLGPINISDDLGDVARDADLTVPDTIALTVASEDNLLLLSGPARIVVLSTPP
jgi:hypothetical protein